MGRRHVRVWATVFLLLAASAISLGGLPMTAKTPRITFPGSPARQYSVYLNARYI